MYHVLNRANGRLPICEKGEDYAAFERVLEEAIDRTGTRLLSYRWSCGTSAEQKILSPWPIRRSPGWLEYVNKPQTDAELAALRRSVNRGSPYGDETWSATATESLGLEITTRPQGRPRKNGS